MSLMLSSLKGMSPVLLNMTDTAVSKFMSFISFVSSVYIRLCISV